MTSKYEIREFADQSYHHCFNRGVEKRDIFLEPNDYFFFIHLLKTAVSEPVKIIQRRNFFHQISIIAYCLMPNHFHLCIYQSKERVISQFMSSILVSYSMYFNKKYNRIGPLFQSRFKSKLIKTDEYLLHLTRYIHLNPDTPNQNIFTYCYSSLNEYLNPHQTWLDYKMVKDILSPNQQEKFPKLYREFITENQNFDLDIEELLWK